MQKIAACHQPNFLPWLGYFSKIVHSDTFFILDDVQLPQGYDKHNWVSRVKILTKQGGTWINVPIKRSGLGKQLISEVQIDNTNPKWQKKIISTIEMSYKKAPFYNQNANAILEIIEQENNSLAQLNIKLIKCFIDILNINTKIILASDLQMQTSSNQHLIDLCKSAEATTYLSGDGADSYQIDQEFAQQGICLERMGFQHPVYSQIHSKELVKGMSIIDALFNVGIEETIILLKNSRKHAK